jgi:DNA repair protein RecN (Recombination protein N)
MNKRPPLFIQQVHLKNFATFVEQKIAFTPQFNCIIGETGSGKSLILKAIHVGLGGKSNQKFIRQGTEQADIHMSFQHSSPFIKHFFHQQGFPISSIFTIQRSFSVDKKNTCFVDGHPCSLAFLKLFAQHFFQFVGQFDNQQLLKPSFHLYLVDYFSKQLSQVEEYRHLYVDFEKTLEQIQQKKKLLEEDQIRKDILSHQIQELEAFQPQEEDEKTIFIQRKSLIESEKMQQIQKELLYYLEDDEAGISQKIPLIKKILSKQSTHPSLQEAYHKCEQLDHWLHELLADLHQLTPPPLSEEKALFVLERFDQYQKLQTKYKHYNKPLEQVLILLKTQWLTLESCQDDLFHLEKKSKQLLTQLESLAKELHLKRQTACQQISTQLTECLHELNMDGCCVQLKCELLPQLNSSGLSQIQFFIETNQGEGPRLLSQVASGGELSRILLAIRTILSGHHPISIFLFDEIDSGLGGETALKIGLKLKEIGRKAQVLSISHLPQLAQQAQHLILVDKKQTQSSGMMRTQSYAKSVTNIQQAIKKMAPLQSPSTTLSIKQESLQNLS